MVTVKGEPAHSPPERGPQGLDGPHAQRPARNAPHCPHGQPLVPWAPRWEPVHLPFAPEDAGAFPVVFGWRFAPRPTTLSLLIKIIFLYLLTFEILLKSR